MTCMDKCVVWKHLERQYIHIVDTYYSIILQCARTV